MVEINLGVTEGVLDALAARSRVVLHNIANQNTPGYKSFRVDFEDQLRDAMRSGGDPAQVKPKIYRDRSGLPGVNNVAVMDELAVLNKVSLLHDVFSRRASGYFSRINSAIRGR